MESACLERAYRNNCGWMFRLAARWLGDDALGADAAHTVWVRIFDNPPENGLTRGTCGPPCATNASISGPAGGG